MQNKKLTKSIKNSYQQLLENSVITNKFGQYMTSSNTDEYNDNSVALTKYNNSNYITCKDI